MSFYKYISNDDRVVSATSLTEQVIHRSGSGGSFPMSSTKRTYFNEVYSGSSNHTYDVTVGRSSQMGLGVATSGSGLISSNIVTDVSRSVSNYNQLAKVLLGSDENGNIAKFSRDADNITTNNIMHNAYFVNFSRGFYKDKIKPGTFSMEVLVSGSVSTDLTGKRTITLSDVSGGLGPTKRLCQTGEYGILYAVPATGTTILNTLGYSSTADSTPFIQGLVFYEAGVAVVSPTIFSVYDSSLAVPATSSNDLSGNIGGIILASQSPYRRLISGSYPDSTVTTGSIADIFQSQSLNDISETLTIKVMTASYQAVTELNSTIYFCRAFNSEFNYSSNPTYLSSSEIRIKGGDPLAQPVSYITSVGLYDDKNQLLAVAKLSEPVKKTPENEIIARVRLDF